MSAVIYGANGRRKYLTSQERSAFLKASDNFDPETRTLCWVISSTGCRISEALSLTMNSIDSQARMIVIESLKKRRRGVYRSIPVKQELIDLILDVHGTKRRSPSIEAATPLWNFSRMTAYRRIRQVMEAAGITGIQAMPKGLRHSFGVTAIQSQVPLNLVQRWLGHADMKTTAIYASAIGPEERSIAAHMWKHDAFRMPTPGTSRRSKPG